MDGLLWWKQFVGKKFRDTLGSRYGQEPSGAEFLYSGAGAEFLYSGAGAEFLYSGAGGEFFYFQISYSLECKQN